MRTLNILIVVVLLATSVLDAQIAIRPGQYEYTLEMNMGEAKEAGKAVMDAAGFQKNKRRECLTPDDVKGDIATVFMRGMEMGDECKMSNVKTIGSKMTFTTTCVEDELRMTMNTEMTFAGDSFAGVTTSKDQQGHVTTMKMSAKRVGDCTQ
jgi:hypothetical protein